MLSMGFLSDRRDLPVKVLIIAPTVRTAACDLSRFRVGEVYEVAPRVAEYLISSGRAIIERRRLLRRKQSHWPGQSDRPVNYVLTWE